MGLGQEGSGLGMGIQQGQATYYLSSRVNPGGQNWRRRHWGAPGLRYSPSPAEWAIQETSSTVGLTS